MFLRKLFGNILILLLLSGSVRAQPEHDTVARKFRIAIFSPLFLDSAFAGEEYRYPKTVFPKFLNPGLEFYEGAQLALDSLNRERAPLEVFIYDTRSSTQSLEHQFSEAERNGVQLIIANCSNSEVRLFADEGLRRNIPVINANLPNDGGVEGNPFFVVLNPTLKTQMEGIYRYIQKYHALDQLVVFRKKGQLEDRIRSYLEEIGKITRSVPLKIRYVDLPDSFQVWQLRAQLDSAAETLCIAGTLDEKFGSRLIQQLASLRKTYPVRVMGMPTWDDINLSRPEYRGIEIVYSNPFYNSRMDRVSMNISNYFSTRLYARPSDMVFRGYEVTWRYARLLLQYGSDVSSNLGVRQPRVFTDFDIQPVLNRETMMLDYFENKKLYFLRWQDGVIKGVY